MLDLYPMLHDPVTDAPERRGPDACAAALEVSHRSASIGRTEPEREDLAAALVWAERFGLSEGVCNHFSVLAGDGAGFWINPQGVHWREITPEALVLCPLGERAAPDSQVELTARVIHGAIHAARPGCAAVLHTHMPAATTLACLNGAKLEMISQNAARFHKRVWYMDGYDGLATSSGEGRRIAAAFTGEGVVVLRHHGVIASHRSVAAAFEDLYYFERACDVQLRALASGMPLAMIPAAVVERTARQFAAVGAEQAESFLRALRRQLGWGARREE